MLQEFEKSLIPWMGKTIKLVDNLIEEVFETNDVPLTKFQFLVLKIIQTNEHIHQNELAMFANRDKSSLARMITTLEKRELLTRTSCVEDKRAKRLHITSKGKRLLKKAVPVILEIINELETGLTKSEIESTIEVLKKVQKNIAGTELGICLNNKKTK